MHDVWWVCVCDVHVCRCLRHGSMERQPNPSAVTRLPQEEPLGTERQRLTEAGHKEEENRCPERRSLAFASLLL